MALALVLGACAAQQGLPPSTSYSSQTASPETYSYQIGPGDQLQIFVWRNPEVSQNVTVRPDGKITTPIKGATLIGNGPEAMSLVSMVGSDLALDRGVGICGKEGQSVPVGVGQPTLKLDQLTVGGTS